MQTKTFDPTSPEYQVSPDFPPDKTKTWEYPPEEDAWTLVHNAIRGELNDIKEAIDVLRTRDTVEPWMMTSLLSMCNVHSIHIHSHHENEDDILAPELNKRFKYPEKVRRFCLVAKPNTRTRVTWCVPTVTVGREILK